MKHQQWGCRGGKDSQTLDVASDRGKNQDKTQDSSPGQCMDMALCYSLEIRCTGGGTGSGGKW